MTSWTTLEQLVAAIPDGALLAPGGFMLGRAPMAAIIELVRQERRGLSVLSLPNPLPAEMLIQGGCATKVEAAFLAISIGNRLRPMPALKRAIEAGTVAWTEHDGYRVVQRLRAAGMGLPFLPAPDVERCALSKEDVPRFVEDPFTGERVAVEPAVYPDVALLHAQAADAQGNLYIEDPTTDLLVANAARRVLATVETRVERLSRITLPGFQVEQVALVPGGALPTGCASFYAHDEAWLLDYFAADKAGRGLAFVLARAQPRAEVA